MDNGFSLIYIQFNEIISRIDSVLETLLKCVKEIFLFINILLTIVCTLPVSVASTERSFSSLRRFKTWMRCQMSEERLSDLAIIHAHTKK